MCCFVSRCSAKCAVSRRPLPAEPVPGGAMSSRPVPDRPIPVEPAGGAISTRPVSTRPVRSGLSACDRPTVRAGGQPAADPGSRAGPASEPSAGLHGFRHCRHLLLFLASRAGGVVSREVVSRRGGDGKSSGGQPLLGGGEGVDYLFDRRWRASLRQRCNFQRCLLRHNFIFQHSGKSL